jgi:hypothetical protein
MICVGAAVIENLNKQHQGQKAHVENKKKIDGNVNNWMCEACDAGKACQGGKRGIEIESSSECALSKHHYVVVASCCSHRCGHPYPVCHDCIWYVMSISGIVGKLR